MKADLKLYVLSAIAGLIVGTVSIAFMGAVNYLTTLVWGAHIPGPFDHYWIIPVILTVFGLLMGVCVKYFGQNTGMGFESVLAASGPSGEIKAVQLPRVVLNGMLGLISGASIGPETPLIAAGGFSGSWLARRLKLAPVQIKAITAVAVGSTLGVLLESPVAGPLAIAESQNKLEQTAYLRLVFGMIVATGVGLALSLAVAGQQFSGLAIIPDYPQFHSIDMLYALIIGAIAGAVGVAFRAFLFKMVDTGRRWDRWPVVRGGVAGLIMGLIGLALPLTLFSGDNELSQVVSLTGQFGAAMLILLAVAKLVAMGVAFAGGYQGGNIFPTLFIGGVLGLAVHALFGFISVPVAMVACIAGVIFALMPMPLFAIFLLTVLSSANLIPVIALGLAGAALVVLAVPRPVATAKP